MSPEHCRKLHKRINRSITVDALSEMTTDTRLPPSQAFPVSVITHLLLTFFNCCQTHQQVLNRTGANVTDPSQETFKSSDLG